MKSLKNLARYLKKYRGGLIAGMAAVFLADVIGLPAPWLLKLAIDCVSAAERFGERPATDGSLLFYAVAFVAVVAVQGLCRWFWRRRLFGVPRRLGYDLRDACFRQLLKLPRRYFLRQNTGAIMSRFTNDIQTVEDFVSGSVMLVADLPVMVPACFILMAAISLKLTLISLVPMTAVTLLFVQFKKQIRQRSEAVQEHLAAIYSMLHENITGIRIVQAFALEGREKEKFAGLNDKLAAKNIALMKFSEGFHPLMIFANGVTAIIVLWLGGREVIQGRMTLGSYMAFTGYLAIFTWAVANIGYVFGAAQRGLAAFARIEEFLAATAEPEDNRAADGPARRNAVFGRRHFSGAVRVDSLTFSYDGQQNVLRGVSLSVPAGSWLAVTGPVGSGKSTLAEVLAGTYIIPGNVVFLDDVDVAIIPVSLWREVIGYVDQEPFLFTGTLRENIIFGVDTATEEAVVRAAAIAGLDGDIRRFPQGLDTLIGERGVTLSGGQKQRVAIARAIIKQPAVLILDDAFSNLDLATEKKVVERIRAEFAGMTVIAISHRASAVQNADLIAVMEDGRVARTGSHDELMAGSALYNRVYRRQYFNEKEMVEE